MRGRLRALILGAVAFAMVVTTLTAEAQVRPMPRGPAGQRISGVVPARTHPFARGGGGGGSNNLLYHGGPVMRTNTTYAIYWLPAGTTMGTGYQTTINQYFTDAAADSGLVSNVYSTETQYFDTTGSIAYSQTFGGSYVDTTPFPASGCPLYSGLPTCLTDLQVQAEVTRAMTAKGWTGGTSHAFFVFLPKSVGTCFDAAGTSCAFSVFCAYHGFFGTTSNASVYANMPYADTFPASCDSGQHPNGNDADATLNVTSHEHREMINDVLLNAWFDRRGFEGSDKCAWTFGAALGNSGTGNYNQVINGHFYYLQQEWSNMGSHCVQRGF